MVVPNELQALAIGVSPVPHCHVRAVVTLPILQMNMGDAGVMFFDVSDGIIIPRGEMTDIQVHDEIRDDMSSNFCKLSGVATSFGSPTWRACARPA